VGDFGPMRGWELVGLPVSRRFDSFPPNFKELSMPTEYNKYLDEKMGGVAIRDDEYDTVRKQIAMAVVNDEQGLRKHVPNSIIHSGDAYEIVKELIKAIELKPNIMQNQVMEIEFLYDYDTDDVEKVLRATK